ncbi:GNAT family N-acetyltransferase [Actinosynnema sp. NPDC020468]|uniref:GNAT family N-acetyltransferase n=1 Tax=Actinosynnema sp. NPDC020468 TaxID=3154488 RepID=UPI00340DEF84
MVEIRVLTEPDRAEWEVLARAHHGHFGGEMGDDRYERTWRRIVGVERVRGVGARVDGRMVGIANYLFHDSVWFGGKCYLADLFVDPRVRRRGVGTALLAWVARDAEEHGFPGLYWNTLEDAPARALYDRVARHHQGLVLYTYHRREQV